MFSAWAVKNGMVLGQIKTDEKSNEITAIPELIKSLELENTIVTIDAMGTQKAIAESIINKKANYVLSLKGNQSNLHDQIKLFFQDHIDSIDAGSSFNFFESVDSDHGRIELRRYWATSDINWLQGKENWSRLKTIIMVQHERHVDDNISIEKAFHISSLENNVEMLANAIRGHWSIENSLHWVLDVCFREDLYRVRKNHAPENLAKLRHIALNQLKQEKAF